MIQKLKRNDAVAKIMGFKKYIPAANVGMINVGSWDNYPIQWYVVPGIGRYNTFELKFDCDWNWLISSVIELKKYEYTHESLHPGDSGFNHELNLLYHKIISIKIINLDMSVLFTAISDYCILLLEIKANE